MEKATRGQTKETAIQALIHFWHWLTTSRYTRHLEEENRELRARVSQLEQLLIPRLALVQPRTDSPQPKAAEQQVDKKHCQECGYEYTGTVCPQCDTPAAKLLTRPRRSFGSIKREIERMEA